MSVIGKRQVRANAFAKRRPTLTSIETANLVKSDVQINAERIRIGFGCMPLVSATMLQTCCGSGLTSFGIISANGTGSHRRRRSTRRGCSGWLLSFGRSSVREFHSSSGFSAEIADKARYLVVLPETNVSGTSSDNAPKVRTHAIAIRQIAHPGGRIHSTHPETHVEQEPIVLLCSSLAI